MPQRKKLFTGGLIWTVDPHRPKVEAVAVTGDRISAVGSVAKCRQILGNEYDEIDLRGGALMPGFYDAHLHPLTSIFYTMNTNLLGVADIPEIIERLRAFAQNQPSDPWIAGLNFDEQAMTKPTWPNREDLDRVSGDRPVIVVKHDGHSLIANSRAMEIAGVRTDTPDPPGGTIGRDADGNPDGIFRETAVQLVLNHLPMPDEDRLFGGATETFQAMLAHGITSLGVILQSDEHGPAGTIGAFDIPVMQMLRDRIPQSTYAWVIAKNIENILSLQGSNLHGNDPWRHSRVAGLKIIADGTFGSSTAAMFDSFADQPGQKGFMLLSTEKLYDRMRSAHNAGLQIAVHAIGDAANHIVVDLYERLLREYPREGHRHRIEHASILDPELLKKAGRLGIVLCMQPMFLHSEKHWLEKRLGTERLRWTYPFASILREGIAVAGSSDSPIESQNVLHAIQCCVTREGLVPEEKISVAQAIEMFTLKAAYSQFEESIKGSIQVGKRADLVQLDQNPFAVPENKLAEIAVRETWIAGQSRYRR